LWLVLLAAAAAVVPPADAAISRAAAVSADVSVSVSGPASVVFGRALTYTVTVTNSGPDASDGITLENRFHNVTTSYAVTQGTCTQDSNVSPVKCSLGSLASGASATLTVNGLAYVGGWPVWDEVTVAAFTPDPNAANNAASATADVEPALVDFSVAGSSSAAAVAAGDTVSYTLVVTNNGGVPVGNYGGALYFDLPAGTTVQNADVDGHTGNCGLSTELPSRFRCVLHYFAPDSTTRAVHLDVYFPQVSAPTAVTVTGQFSLGADSSVIVDQNPSNDLASLVTTVSHAEAQLMLSGTGPAQAGYTSQPPYPAAHVYTVTNAGSDAAANVTVVVSASLSEPAGPLPPPTSPSATCAVSPYGHPVIGSKQWLCVLGGALLPGSSANITIPVSARPGTVETTTAVAQTTTPTSGAAPTTSLYTSFVDVPGAPIQGYATAGDGQASVLFAAPAADGGAPISSYTVTASPGGMTATGRGAPITVTGLVNGIGYSFTVTATNLAGTGPASEPTDVVTPSAPTTSGGGGGGGGGSPAVPDSAQMTVPAASIPPALAPLPVTSQPKTVALIEPVIGKPVIRPLPAAGKAVLVSFKVTSSDTGAKLTNGRVSCDPSMQGKPLVHATQFRNGTANVRFTIPKTARGKLLKVRLTIKLGGRSATRIATFIIR